LEFSRGFKSDACGSARFAREHGPQTQYPIISNNLNDVYWISEQLGGAMQAPGFNETSAFVAVLEQRSFTRAAKQLGLSPARVSELMRSLEERLGVRLVERTTRSVMATEAGERFLARLRPVLDEYQAALDSLNDFRAKPVGTLRLTVPPPAAEFVLAPIIARFHTAYPEINLDISVDSALTDIVTERFDAGIRPGERVARDMIAVRIGDPMRVVVAASPTYLAQHGTPKSPHDLEQHNCIRFRFPSGIVLPWRFGTKRRSLEVQVDGSLIVNDSTLALRAVTDGLGLMQFALVYFAPALAEGRVVTVLDDWAPPPFEGFYLYYPSRRQIRPPLKVFVEFLRSSQRTKLPMQPVTKPAT
jgi:DNA-binding transcriptional LysR family regulator